MAGTGAKTRVLIQSTDGKREWGTVGVSENIITASLEALVDSMEYALLKKSPRPFGGPEPVFAKARPAA